MICTFTEHGSVEEIVVPQDLSTASLITPEEKTDYKNKILQKMEDLLNTAIEEVEK